MMREYIQEKNRIYLTNDDGVMIAEITFPDIDERTVDINHTFVDNSLRGQGIAGELVEAAVVKLKEENKKIVPTCPYVVNWFKKNVEYTEILKSSET